LVWCLIAACHRDRDGRDEIAHGHSHHSHHAPSLRARCETGGRPPKRVDWSGSRASIGKAKRCRLARSLTEQPAEHEDCLGPSFSCSRQPIIACADCIIAGRDGEQNAFAPSTMIGHASSTSTRTECHVMVMTPMKGIAIIYAMCLSNAADLVSKNLRGTRGSIRQHILYVR
jgi:hypothetical protein